MNINAFLSWKLPSLNVIWIVKLIRQIQWQKSSRAVNMSTPKFFKFWSLSVHWWHSQTQSHKFYFCSTVTNSRTHLILWFRRLSNTLLTPFTWDAWLPAVPGQHFYFLFWGMPRGRVIFICRNRDKGWALTSKWLGSVLLTLVIYHLPGAHLIWPAYWL